MCVFFLIDCCPFVFPFKNKWISEMLSHTCVYHLQQADAFYELWGFFVLFCMCFFHVGLFFQLMLCMLYVFCTTAKICWLVTEYLQKKPNSETIGLSKKKKQNINRQEKNSNNWKGFYAVQCELVCIWVKQHMMQRC